MNRFTDSTAGRVGLGLALVVALMLAILVAWPDLVQGAPRPRAAAKVNYLELAAILIRDAHFDRAARLLGRVNPRQKGLDLKRYHKLLGIVAAKRGDHRGAVTHLQRALALGEKNPRLNLQIAQSRFRLGDYAGALASLRAAGPTAQKVWGASLIRVQAHWRLGQRFEAFAALDRGLRRHPQAQPLRRLRILLLIRLKLYGQALDEGSRYLARGTPTLQDILGIAESFRRAGQAHQAALILEQARLRHPAQRQVLLQLSRCYLDDGKPLAAATLLHRASLLDAGLRVEAAELYRRAGKITHALLLNAQVTDQRKKFKQRLGLLIQRGRFEEAVALEPRLSRLGLLAEPQLQYALAYSLFRVGEMRRAEAWLKRISSPALFHKVVELRRVMAACRQAGWQCPN